jgi:hypothetical protein
MMLNRQAPAIAEEKHPRISASHLIRWTGLAAVVAGILFVAIQPLHPSDGLASVDTTRWVIIHCITVAMGLLILLGVAGLYARQVEQVGWLGLAGFLMFSLGWALQVPIAFAEALILPRLVTESPTYVESYLGMFNGHSGQIDLGALATVYAVSGLLYMLGGLLFGIATFRAGVFSRWASGLLAATAAVTPVAALLPHDYQRLVAIPMGVALAWLGYALWSERRERAMQSVPDLESPQLRPTAAE